MDSSKWDQRYEASDRVWSSEPNLFLPPLVEGLDPGTALDLACGEGRNAIWLARHGWDVTGVDFSAAGIEKARRLGRDTSVEWVVADVTTYDPGRKFDLVVVFYLHLPPPQLAKAFGRAVDAVAHGGTLLAVGHALRNMEEGYGGPPYPEIHWTEDLLRPLARDLEIIELGEHTSPVTDAGAEAETIDLVLHAVAR